MSKSRRSLTEASVILWKVGLSHGSSTACSRDPRALQPVARGCSEVPVIGVSVASGTEGWLPRTELARREHVHPAAETRARGTQQEGARVPARLPLSPGVLRAGRSVPSKAQIGNTTFQERRQIWPTPSSAAACPSVTQKRRGAEAFPLGGPGWRPSRLLSPVSGSNQGITRGW